MSSISQRLIVSRKARAEATEVALSKATTTALKRWLDLRPNHGEESAMFLGTNAQRTLFKRRRIGKAFVGRLVSALAQLHGEDTSPHRIRHTSISLADRARSRLGLPFSVGMERAGHKSLGAHQRYFDRQIDDEEKLTEAVAGVVARRS